MLGSVNSRCKYSKIDVLDQWCLRRILNICWYHEVWRITDQPPLTSVIQKRRLMLFGKSRWADARRILTAVPQSDWKRRAGHPHTFWMATMKNDLSYHNLSMEGATKLALDRPLWSYWQQTEPNNDVMMMIIDVMMVIIFSVLTEVWKLLSHIQSVSQCLCLVCSV